MKRLGIFCFFEKDGIVDKYVEYLTHDLKKNLTKLVVVINGDIRSDEEEKLNLYADEIYKRENKGYDGGAYAEYIKRNRKSIELEEWDEIVLCNNSFFGPMIPFVSVFEEMEKKEHLDFWGLRLVDKQLFSYLESYFLVFKKRTLLSGDLFSYFTDNAYLDNASYLEVCSCFERGLFAYLCWKGYQYGAYGEQNEYDIFSGADVNLICYNVPIIKRKAVDIVENYNSQLKNVAAYLQDHNQYDFELINIYLRRQQRQPITFGDFRMEAIEKNRKKCKCITQYDCSKEDLEKFIDENEEIYIYGAGYLAGNIWWAYKYKINDFKGFIVTEKGRMSTDNYFGEEIKEIGDIPLDSNIIVALNKKNTLEVKEIIDGKYNVFYFWNME